MIKALIVLLIFSGSSFAKEITWEDAVAEAKNSNPSLKKAEESVSQARQYYYRSYTGFLPQLSASAGSSQSKSDSADFSRDYSMGLSASLSVFSGFGDISEVKIKNYELKIALANYNRAVSDVMYNLRKCFVNLLWAQETANLSQKILDRRKENNDMIRLKYEAGREDKGSLLRVEADKLQAEYDLNKAKRALNSASLQLVKAIGRDDFEVVAVTGNLSAAELPKMPSIEETLMEIPEYLTAYYNLKKSAISITSARSSLFPELSISANNSKTGQQWAPENSRWSLSLNASYPFFPGGRNIYDIKIANINRTIYEQSFKETRQQLAVKIDGAIVSYIDSFEIISVREQYLNASAEQSKISTAKYINGLTSYQDWYTIENDYINARKALLNARRDTLLSGAQLKNVLGE